MLARLHTAFRPEFLNRLDDVIVFHALDPGHIEKIVDIQFSRFRERLLSMEIDAELSPAARSLLAEAGFDPVYGARPLKRVFQRRLGDALAREMLEGRLKAGDRLGIDVENGRLAFRVPRTTDALGIGEDMVVESRSA